MKFIVLSCMLIAAMLLLAGCAGSAPQAGANENAGAGANANGGTNAPPKGDAPASPSNGANAPSGSNPAAPKDDASSSGIEEAASASLLKYFGMAGNGWTVHYDFQSSGTGGAVSGKMGTYFKNAENMRMDSEMSGVSTRSYIKGEEIVSCYNMGSSWSCMKISSFNKSDSEKMKDDLKSNPSKYKVEKLPSRTILGVSAECFKSTVENGWAEYCFSPEGVTLYLHTEGSQQGVSFQTTMAATSYKLSVSDSDFVLPATPSAAPSFPGMGAGASGSSGSAGAGSSPSAPSGGDVCAYCSYLSGSDKADCLASC